MMARTAALKPEQVPADSKPTLDAFTKKTLDVKTRDSIGLAVSEVNGCNYCLTVHSFTAEHMAKPPADESFSLGRAMPVTRSGTPPSSLRAKSSRPEGRSVTPI
jgi:AhpD family alkylhydroperoxidase